MPHLVIHQEKLTPALMQTLIGLCPFGAISEQNGQLVIDSGCRLCRQCVKAGDGAVELCEDVPATGVDKSLWRGIAVFAELRGNEVHPVVLELIGKALELRESCPQPVWAVLIGHDCHDAANELTHYGVDAVFVYDDPLLGGFDPQRYTTCLSDFIARQHPAAVMVGATMLGRSLAPRTAARFRTGLTADCTRLEMRENSDLVQIRPAFGGNIMARILTPHARPQFCTVRYRVFDRAARHSAPVGPAISLPLPDAALSSGTEIIKRLDRPQEVDISEAERIVAVGRGVRDQRGLELAQRLARALDAQLACSRPMVESGAFDPRRQIGLSGRTVKPSLLIALGISGSVQFAAGMGGAERVIAINQDAAAPIMRLAHIAIEGDLYQILPALLERIEKGEAIHA